MAGCRSCSGCGSDGLIQIGLDVAAIDHVVALAGNPNTGKSTVFNALTGLRQHVGNWPGKTVARAEGVFEFGGARFKVVDLPGTYSLLSTSTDEEIARDFLLFGQPDAVVVVVDATCVERNLNLVLQVFEITDRVLVGLNLMDEAQRKGLRVDPDRLARELGVPVVPLVANRREGIPKLVEVLASVCRGECLPAPRRVATRGEALQAADELVPLVEAAFPSLPNARWIALRLIEGDEHLQAAIENGELERTARSLERVSPA